MSITTSNTLSAPVQQSFSYKLLAVPTPRLIHKIPCELKQMPRNGGTTLRMRRPNPLATCPVPLGPGGMDPPPQNYTALNIDAKMSFYGTYVLLNEQVTLQSQDPVLNEIAERLGVSLRQTEDQLLRDCLQATSAFYNCVGGVDADLPTEITRSDIDGVVRRLINNNADMFMTGIAGEDRFGTAPIRESFFALGHTQLVGQLENVQGFISKWNYPNQQSTLSAEWGAVGNSRFLLSSVGSVTPNASAINHADVYNIFFVAKESYANIEQDGHSARFIYRPAIFSGPLAQNITVGYTFASVPRVLNDQWALNLRATIA